MNCSACGRPNVQVTFNDALECLDCGYWVRIEAPPEEAEDIEEDDEEAEATPMDYCQ